MPVEGTDTVPTARSSSLSLRCAKNGLYLADQWFETRKPSMDVTKWSTQCQVHFAQKPRSFASTEGLLFHLLWHPFQWIWIYIRTHTSNIKNEVKVTRHRQCAYPVSDSRIASRQWESQVCKISLFTTILCKDSSTVNLNGPEMVGDVKIFSNGFRNVHGSTLSVQMKFRSN